MTNEELVILEEKQRLNLSILWLAVLAPVVIVWYGFFSQIIRKKPWGQHPASDLVLIILVALFGVGLPWLFLKTCLILQIRPDGFYYRFVPFNLKFRKIPWFEVKNAEVITFSAIKDYGGYGIRYYRQGKAYIAKGKKGLKLQLASGREIVFSSKDPESFLRYFQPHPDFKC